MGARSFNFSAPRLWNSLPPHIKQSDSITTFKSQLTCSNSHTTSNWSLSWLFVCFVLFLFYLFIYYYYFSTMSCFKRFMITLCSVSWPWVSWKAPFKLNYYYYYRGDSLGDNRKWRSSRPDADRLIRLPLCILTFWIPLWIPLWIPFCQIFGKAFVLRIEMSFEYRNTRSVAKWIAITGTL